MINLVRNDDATYTLTYRERDVGYISKVVRYATKQRLWRLVSIYGQIEYAPSLKSAKRRLLELHH
jgi:hypothetical protein